MKTLLLMLHRASTERDQSFALATLVKTQGSTYRKAGARMLIDEFGDTLGVLSGGCLEETIAARSQEVIRTGVPQLMKFDARQLYGCDGHLEILVEKIPAAGQAGNVLTQIEQRLRNRESIRLCTCYGGTSPGTRLTDSQVPFCTSPGQFIQDLPLPYRLLIFGSGPEVEPLLRFCVTMGWLVQHFSHPSEMDANITSDAHTAALIMTHNFGRDLDALDRVLPLRLPYVGLLGPKRRFYELMEKFDQYREFDATLLDPIHAPAGLDIGSEAPEEIALSIISEVAAVLSKRPAGFLRDRKSGPIHVEQAQVPVSSDLEHASSDLRAA